MARKLIDVLMGRSIEEVDAQDPEKIKANLEQSFADFDNALIEGSTARKIKSNGFKKATEALRSFSNPHNLKRVPSE